jgi:hypothetical protein
VKKMVFEGGVLKVYTDTLEYPLQDNRKPGTLIKNVFAKETGVTARDLDEGAEWVTPPWLVDWAKEGKWYNIKRIREIR